jgi:hypothetical protein
MLLRGAALTTVPAPVQTKNGFRKMTKLKLCLNFLFYRGQAGRFNLHNARGRVHFLFVPGGRVYSKCHVVTFLA